MPKKTPYLNPSSLGFPLNDEIANFCDLSIDAILQRVESEAERIIEAQPDFSGESEYPESNWFGSKMVEQLIAASKKEPHFTNVKLEGVIPQSKKQQIASAIYCTAGYIRTHCGAFSTKKKSKFSRSWAPLSEREECELMVKRAIQLGLMIAQQDFWKDLWPHTQRGASLAQQAREASVKGVKQKQYTAAEKREFCRVRIIAGCRIRSMSRAQCLYCRLLYSTS